VSAEFPAARPRRLRRTAALRRLVAQTSVQPSDLVLPLFVKETVSEPTPIASMPGVMQHTLSSVRKAAAEALHEGLGGVMLYGNPANNRSLTVSWRCEILTDQWMTCGLRFATKEEAEASVFDLTKGFYETRVTETDDPVNYR